MMPRAALFPSISVFQSLVSCLRVSGIAFTQLITHTLYSTHPLYITRWYVLGTVDNQRCLMWHEFCLTVHSSVGRWLDRWLHSEVGSDMIGAWRKELRDFPGGEELRLWASTSESTGLISGHGLRSHMLCTQKKKGGELITYNWSSDVGRSHSQFEERPQSKGIQSLVLKVGMWFRCSISGRGSYHMSK